MSKQVTPTDKSLHLIEIMQQNKTQFALAGWNGGAKVIQCHPWVHCRDYMLDAYVSLEDNRPMGIYGFHFDETNPRPWKDGTSLLMKFSDDGALKNFQDNFQIIKNIEAFLGWEVSLPELVEFPDIKNAVAWIIGDPRWCATAISFSLYTYLLKCLTFSIKNPEKWEDSILGTGTNEAQYMNAPYIKWLLAHFEEICGMYKTFSGWFDQKNTPTGYIHDHGGFVSLRSKIWDTDANVYKTSMYSGHALEHYHASEDDLKCAA